LRKTISRHASKPSRFGFDVDSEDAAAGDDAEGDSGDELEPSASGAYVDAGLLTFAYHEDFSTSKALARCGHVCERTAAGGPICMHINVSDLNVDKPPEPQLDDKLLPLSLFLHNLVGLGLLSDAKTGELVAVDCTRPHHVFLELPATTDFPTDPAVRVSPERHPYVKHLSVVESLTTSRQSIHPGAVPFIIDDDARLVAFYADFYASTTKDWNAPSVQEPGQPPVPAAPAAPAAAAGAADTAAAARPQQPRPWRMDQVPMALAFSINNWTNFPSSVTPTDMSDAAARASLDRLWAAFPQVPRSALHRTLHVRLLADRLRFLPDLQVSFKT
jgi:hypothetical protein